MSAPQTARRAVRIAAALCFGFAMAPVLPPPPASAQVALPYVPPETYPERRWLQGNRITFCIWSVSPTAALDRRIGEEIGAALLLETEFHDYASAVPHTDDRFWEQVYIQLATTCDAVMGFALVSQIVLDWLTPTRPYYEGPFVVATADPALGRLGDLAPRSVVGSILYSTADLRLIEYLELQPADARWTRLPLTDPGQMLDLLSRGTLAAGLIWEPMLQTVLAGREETGIREIPLDPLVAPPTPIGMMLRNHNLFLRGEIDRAIGSLIEDGVIAEILDELGLGAGVPR
jgi:hypothetical protein